jgi:hypothetical protein
MESKSGGKKALADAFGPSGLSARFAASFANVTLPAASTAITGFGLI